MGRWPWGWVRWGHGLNLYSWVVGLLVSGGRVAEKCTYRRRICPSQQSVYTPIQSMMRQAEVIVPASNLDMFKHPLFSKIVTVHWFTGDCACCCVDTERVV